jgi:hypothetical protein
MGPIEAPTIIFMWSGVKRQESADKFMPIEFEITLIIPTCNSDLPVIMGCSITAPGKIAILIGSLVVGVSPIHDPAAHFHHYKSVTEIVTEPFAHSLNLLGRNI